ncbi:MAG TPA: PAS domain-containing sensor histidine kinase [Gaiellaceae bacterium]|nr:PAS domain-containing sensor histidine kinase [Gaiellaceae bacterium]
MESESLRVSEPTRDERFLERTAEPEDQGALLEAVIENIPAGLVVVSSDGKAVLANSEAMRMLGRESFDRDALDDWPPAETRHLDGRPVQSHEWPLARTLASGEVVAGEKYELVSQGQHVIVEISAAPVVAKSGGQTGGVAVFRDVTTQERSERAERDFVTNAAHELQSPLAAIVSAVEVLQSGAKDGPERDLFLGHIERESTRLASLVTALMVLARSQIGVEAPRDETVGLRALFREVGSTLRLRPGVELVIDCPEDLAVLTNRELVEQAVVNLAENAAKHTTSGRVSLGGAPLPADRVEISVADTGPGIPPAERPRIFERFYRSAESAGPGFGLGLSIVRAVADALEGELELDSTVGAGTVVRLRLPRAAKLVTS